MKPQRLFVFECDQARYERRVGAHDRVEFRWDGERNLADPTSVGLAELHDKLKHGLMKCRCGSPLYGGEVQQIAVELVNEPSAAKFVADATASLKRLEEATQRLESGLLWVANRIEGIEKRLDQQQKESTTMATMTIGDARPATEKTAVQRAKEFGKDVSGEVMWRSLAAQAAKTAREGLVASVLKAVPKQDKELRRQITKFAKTEYGEALAGVLVAGGLYLTGMTPGSKKERFAKELVYGSGATALTKVLDGPLNFVRSFIFGGLDTIVESLPDAPAEQLSAPDERVAASTVVTGSKVPA